MSQSSLRVLPLLLSVSLAACGGGSGPAPAVAPAVPPPVVQPPPVVPPPVVTPPVVTPPPVVVPEPVVNAAATLAAQFVQRARQDKCADIDNRLWVIDRKYVYKIANGSCMGAAYESAQADGLFDLATQEALCAYSQQIYKSVCKDAAAQALMDAIRTDLPSLGLGAPVQVEAVSFLRPDGTALVFGTKERSLKSDITTPRKVVVRDAAAYRALMAEHNGSMAGPDPLGSLDFERDMVIAIFAGTSPYCTAVTIDRVGVSAGKIVVDYEIFDSQATGVHYGDIGSYDAGNDIASNQCQQQAAPMQLIVAERNSAAVEFVQKLPVRLPFTILVNTTRDRNWGKRNLVIKDAAAWTRAWSEAFANGGLLEAPPQVDFSRKMVVAVFQGGQPNLCYGTRASGVYRSAKGIVVSTTEVIPGPGLLCAAALGSPAMIMAIDRSDEPVEFISHVENLRY